MNGTEAYWRRALLSRFSDREDVGKDGFYERYYAPTDLPKEAVLEFLELIESEYQFPGGLLRPGDKLAKLFEPIPTKNPWRWLVYQTRTEDRQSELNDRLAKRMSKFGTLGTWPHIETVDDLIHAWCGVRPTIALRE